MRPRQIPDVNVIADAGAITRGVIGAGDGEFGEPAELDIHQAAEGVGGRLKLQPGAHLRVSADGIEVAQRDAARTIGGAEIAQDHFHHELGARVRAGWVERGSFR